jgi:transcription termination factor Rho
VSVLKRKELEDSPLADIHAIASELGIEGYRGLRREDLVDSILKTQGGDAAAPEAPAEPSSEQPDGEIDDKPKPRARRSRRGRGRSESTERPEPEASSEDADADVDDSSEDDDADREVVTGVLDVQSNSSGFLRREEGSDVYVSPAQIRRCEMRAGDDVSGPVRPPRRNERHPSLIRVETVNGADAEPPEQRPWFGDLTPVAPKEPLGELKGASYGKGARVAIVGPAGAGASPLLQEAVTSLAAAPGDLSVAVVLAGVRPEEVADWRGVADVRVVGGAFDRDADRQTQAAVLAVERGKRIAERGGDAVVVVDSLASLDPRTAKRVFGAARKLEQGGSLTVIAAVGDGGELLRLASTRIVLEPGGGDPAIAAAQSGAQRADLLG